MTSLADTIKAARPMVPAKDFDISLRFYSRSRLSIKNADRRLGGDDPRHLLFPAAKLLRPTIDGLLPTIKQIDPLI
jgi:hypothetical protein